MKANYLGLLAHDKAKLYEISQLASSGCGVTALLNVLIALKILPPDQACNVNWSSCILRTRDNDAALGQYLLSRSIAGCTGEDLVSSMSALIADNHDLLGSTYAITGSFRSYADIVASGVTMRQFIIDSLSQGCCLVATLNLQILGNDAWHHQMIYGIDTGVGDLDPNVSGSSNSSIFGSISACNCNIHCVNPVEAYPEYLFEKFLSTPSVLLVMSEDIISRYDRPNSDDSVYDRKEWLRFGVQRQIAAVMNAHVSGAEDGPSHVVIPASYVGGFAIFQRHVQS